MQGSDVDILDPVHRHRDADAVFCFYHIFVTLNSILFEVVTFFLVSFLHLSSSEGWTDEMSRTPYMYRCMRPWLGIMFQALNGWL